MVDTGVKDDIHRGRGRYREQRETQGQKEINIKWGSHGEPEVQGTNNTVEHPDHALCAAPSQSVPRSAGGLQVEHSVGKLDRRIERIANVTELKHLNPFTEPVLPRRLLEPAYITLNSRQMQPPIYEAAARRPSTSPD